MQSLGREKTTIKYFRFAHLPRPGKYAASVDDGRHLPLVGVFFDDQFGGKFAGPIK